MNEELRAMNAKLELNNLLLKAQETLESKFLAGEDQRNVQALIQSLNQFLDGENVDVPLNGDEPHIKVALSRMDDHFVDSNDMVDDLGKVA